MPSRKRALSRSYTTAGSMGKRRRVSVAATANAALSMVRRLNSQQEIKAAGFAVSGGSITTTQNVKHCTAIAQGDGNNERVGDFIQFKKLSFRGYVTQNSNNAFQNLVRIIVVQNVRQQAGTDATMVSQFSSASILALDLSSVGFKNLVVLHDKLYTADAQPGATTVSGRRFIQFEVTPRFPCKVSYSGAASTDIDRNGIYIIAISDDTTNAPVLSYEALTHFTD